MKALIAVSEDVNFSIILRVWPPAKSPEDPWGCEFEACQSRNPEDLGLKAPKKPGFWIWEGNTHYPGPNHEGINDSGPEWRGKWREADSGEIYHPEVPDGWLARGLENAIHETEQWSLEKKQALNADAEPSFVIQCDEND